MAIRIVSNDLRSNNVKIYDHNGEEMDTRDIASIKIYLSPSKVVTAKIEYLAQLDISAQPEVGYEDEKDEEIDTSTLREMGKGNRYPFGHTGRGLTKEEIAAAEERRKTEDAEAKRLVDKLYAGPKPDNNMDEH
ncbi:MAG: hypothetical protein OXU36_10640 [Candidatus Poribacteria bacterium]|nr:hypothetical protein [Candidatus Poribacteria bacterium]